MAYSPWGGKESDTAEATEHACAHTLGLLGTVAVLDLLSDLHAWYSTHSGYSKCVLVCRLIRMGLSF